MASMVKPSTARILVLLSVPALIYFSYSAARKAFDIYELHQETVKVQREIDLLKSRYAELQQEMNYFRSDEYVEKVAREELNLIKPGDNPVVIVSRVTTPESSVTPVPVAVEKAVKSNWEQWADFVLGRQ